MLQRARMTSSSRGESAPAPRAGLRPRGPAADSHAIAIMPAAATPQVHHGLPLPSWRELKKWRMTGPIASTIATMSQLYRVAYSSG